jgi:DNA-3-methyladenine glycosylase
VSRSAAISIDSSHRSPGRKLARAFYNRDAAHLAPALIGTILVRRIEGSIRRARIVETEAYIGPHDLACHASKGRTNRTEVMFGPPGHAYIYLIYGMYQMLNIVAAEEGNAQAVLVRAAEPLDGWDADLSGPGRLARAFALTRNENGADLTGESFYLEQDLDHGVRIGRDKRVGIDYARHWKHRLLRFYDRNSPAVSKPKPRGMIPPPGGRKMRAHGGRSASRRG